MANPQDPGTFEYWIAGRMMFKTIPPKSGDTGDFEKWRWDREHFEDYVEMTAITIPRHPATIFQGPAIV